MGTALSMPLKGLITCQACLHFRPGVWSDSGVREHISKAGKVTRQGPKRILSKPGSDPGQMSKNQESQIPNAQMVAQHLLRREGRIGDLH